MKAIPFVHKDAEIRLDLGVFLCSHGLAFKAFQAWRQFSQNIEHPVEITLGNVQSMQGFLTTRAIKTCTAAASSKSLRRSSAFKARNIDETLPQDRICPLG